MTFKEIYTRIIPLWGNEINIQDGIILENESFAPGFSSLTLSNLWDEAEIKTKHSNEFDALMVWTMYQVFHKNAIKLFNNGIMVFDPRNISKTEIERQYFENLNVEGYEKELKLYIREVEE
jgi:hypothetical protein